MNQAAIKELIIDLRSPPSGFPKFNMDYNYFVDEDGKTYGDLTAYVACRALKHPNRIPNFLIDGGDLYTLFKKHTGLDTPSANRLVYPGELVNSAHDITQITGHDMADVLQQFLDTQVVDYRGILARLQDSPEFHNKYSSEGIGERVSGFIERYGDKTKQW